MRERLFSLLDLYVGRQLLLHFVLTAAAIGGLVFLFDTLELLRRTTDNTQLGFLGVCGLALLKLPHGLEVTFPFAIMIATMHMLFRLSRSNQLIAMLSAGRSVWQLIATPAALALCLGIANLAFFDPMAAHLYEDFRELDETLVRKLDHPFDISKAGIWAQEKHDGETTVLFSPTVHEQGAALVFDHVTLFKNAADKPQERFEADGGRLFGGMLQLHNVWHFALSTGVPIASHTESYSVPTTLTSERLQDSFAPPDTMTVSELHDFISNSENAGFASARHRLYLQSQIASPLLYVAMVLVAAAFYLLPSPRLVGWIIRGAAALFAGFALYFWNRFTFALGLSGELPIPLAAWSSTATVLLLSVSYLMHRQDG